MMNTNANTLPSFITTAPLQLNTRSSSRLQTSKSQPVCATRRPAAHRPNIPRAIIFAAGALLSGIHFNPLPAHILTPPATAANSKSTESSTSPKALRYDGRQELDSREKAMSLTLTAGTFATLGIWAWRQNRTDDELESVRIKEEVERLEKLRAEFVDVEQDDGAMDDEDLLASLKQRISEGEEDGENKVAGSSDDEPDDGLEGSSSGTGTATLDRDPSESDPSSANDVDILKRMWDATDDDNEKDKKK